MIAVHCHVLLLSLLLTCLFPLLGHASLPFSWKAPSPQSPLPATTPQLPAGHQFWRPRFLRRGVSAFPEVIRRRVLTQKQGGSLTRVLRGAGEEEEDLNVQRGRVGRLNRRLQYAPNTPQSSLTVARLHAQEPSLRSGFLFSAEETTARGTEEESPFVSCAAAPEPCPQLSPCQLPAAADAAVSVSVCSNPDLEDSPRRVKPRVHVWPFSLEYNPQDECIQGVSGAAEDVLRPGCSWEGNRWRGMEGEKGFQGMWRQSWGGHVLVLHDVLLDSYGRVFNSTHLFDAGGCLTHPEFSYPPTTAITEEEEVVNLMSGPLIEIPGQKASEKPGQRTPALEVLAFEMPLLLPALRALSALSKKRTVLASHHKQFHRWVSAHLLGSDSDSFAEIFHSIAAPAPSTLWHVKRLLQPVFQACGQPSAALWRQVRIQHLLSEHSVRALQEQTSVGPTPPMVPPSMPLIPRDWVVVVHDEVLTAVKEGQQVMAALAQFFPAQRILVHSSTVSVKEGRDILSRAVLFITAAHSALGNVIFMPPNATILELRTEGQPPEKHVESELGRALAEACDVRSTVLFCKRSTWTMKKQISCSMVEMTGLIDRAAMDAYTAHPPPRVKRLPAGRVQPEAGPAQVSWFKKPKEEVELFEEWARCVSEKGRWEYNPKPRVLPWGYRGYINRCDHRHLAAGGLVSKKSDDVVAEGIKAKDWNVRETLKWEWRVPPGACPASSATPTGKDPFAVFSGFQFCKRVAKGRTIMVLGDSLQEQFVDVFMNNLLKDYPKPAGWAVEHTVQEECKAWLPPGWDKPHYFCHEFRFAKEFCPGFRLMFLRNDHLTLANDRAFDHMEWTRFTFLAEVDILVLNVGPHYRTTPVFARDLEATLRYVRNRFPDLVVVFRNTPPGHLDCDKLPERPLAQRQDPRTLPFNWGEFVPQNEVARELVTRHDCVYMDVDTMTALRPDGHKGLKDDNRIDCLHYCTPGPQDLWVQHLYNTLLWAHPLPSYNQGDDRSKT